MAGVGGGRPTLRCTLLGGVGAEVDGCPVALTAQLEHLLGALLADRGRVVSHATLVERIWPVEPPPSARKLVHVQIGRLRRVLEPGLERSAEATVLRTRGSGYVVEPAGTDVDDYLSWVDLARRDAASEPARALAHTERALALWTGRPWGDQGDEPWLQPTVVALEEQHRDTDELWGDLKLRLGEAHEAIPRLRAAVAAEPLRGRRWEQLMIALFRAGRQPEAVRAYEEARVLLRDELGLDPGLELQRLHVRILQSDESLHDGARAEAGATATAFVGRAEELQRLDQLVQRNRVVTVVGFGGVGKSRLLLEWAHRRRLSGAAVRWASLTTLSDPSRLAVHVATEIGVHAVDAVSGVDALSASLRRGRVLLVLDAAERFSSETTGLVLELVARCPDVRIVVTSRYAIGLPGERILELQPLPLPDDRETGPAFQLLLDRIGLDRDDLTADTEAALRTVCTRTSGIPILLELAGITFDVANRSPTCIALDDDDRERTVGAVIADALDAVSDDARELATAAALLPAGVGERIATALVDLDDGAVRRALRELVWTRLMDIRPARGAPRFRSLDPIRDVLAASLDDSDRVHALVRTGEALAVVLRLVCDDPLAPIAVSYLDLAEDEHDNLRFVLGELVRVCPGRALELAIAASWFWPYRGHSVEGRRWLETALDAAAPDDALRWSAVVAVSRVTRNFGETADLRPQLEAAAAEMRRADADPMTRATALLYLAIARGWSGDAIGAAAALDEGELVIGDAASPWIRAHVERLRGLLGALGGDLVRPRAVQRDFARRMEALGDPIGATMGWYLAAVLGDMAGAHDVRDDIARARAHAEVTGDVGELAQLLRLEAQQLSRSNDPRAREVLREAAQQLQERGGVRAAAIARRDLALAALDELDREHATAELVGVVPLLLRLDRPAAAVACAALAAVASRAGAVAVAETCAHAARALRDDGAPVGAHDAARIDGYLTDVVSSHSPQRRAAVDDERLLGALDELAAAHALA